MSNVFALDAARAQKAQQNSISSEVKEALAEIKRRHLADEDIDVFGLVCSLDGHNLDPIRDFLIEKDIMGKRDWNNTLRKVKQVRKYGKVPRTSLEFVELWVQHNKVSVSYNRTMRSDIDPMLDGMPITMEARESARDFDLDNTARILEDNNLNTETMARKLRLESKEYDFGFTRDDIADAVAEWFDHTVKERVMVTFGQISYNKMSAKTSRDHWGKFTAAFEATEHSPEFVEAVIRKFMWQVKRKILKMDITDHLMPVILGPQGKGKSTIIRDRLLKPVEELTLLTSFQSITDHKIIDMWRYYVLFLDEMGYAIKADIDEVKNCITAPTLDRRPMRTNDSIVVAQNATFIGCSNKELDQLVRDETGIRRFVALRFGHDPDYAAINSVDYEALWQSVDERGPDPMAPFKDELRVKQDAMRERSPVERWLEQYSETLNQAGKTGKAMRAGSLFEEFSEWAERNCPGLKMHDNTWGKEMRRIINANPSCGWQKGERSREGAQYIFNGIE